MALALQLVNCTIDRASFLHRLYLLLLDVRIDELADRPWLQPKPLRIIALAAARALIFWLLFFFLLKGRNLTKVCFFTFRDFLDCRLLIL